MEGAEGGLYRQICFEMNLVRGRSMRVTRLIEMALESAGEFEDLLANSI